MDHTQKGLYVANKRDNVAIALQDASAGLAACNGETSVETIELLEEIPFGFKAAIQNIDVDEDIIKYGITIGKATRPIQIGQKVHLHNCRSLYDERSSTLDPETAAPTDMKYD